MIGLDVRSCYTPYSFPSPLNGNAVAQSWCYHCCDESRSSPLIVGQFHMDAVLA